MDYYIHALDPVLVQIGPIAIRWYSLAYIGGFILGWRYCIWLISRPPHGVRKAHLDDYLIWVVLGVIIGGRLGHVFFYYPGHYLQNPLSILAVWEGGMAFHGGALGVFVATFLYCRRYKIPFPVMGDLVCAAVPLGLFFGRVANFINGELWGRVTDVPWAVVFPVMDMQPRHPSQLYQGLMEGLLIFIVIFVLEKTKNIRRRAGLASGIFFLGYGIARSIGEVFREPEVLQATLPFGTTWGQWLSLPMILFGLALIIWVYRRPEQGVFEPALATAEHKDKK